MPNPIPTLQPQPQASISPQAIAELRRYARVLSEQRAPKVPFYTVWNGLGDLSRSVFGGMYARQADIKEQEAARQAGKAALGLDDDTTTSPARDSGVLGRIGSAVSGLFGGGTGSGSESASVRTNNPGAQWDGPTARQFGATSSVNLPGGNNAAVFPDPESGAAAQFALLSKDYAGMPLNAAIKKWSGGNNSDEYVRHITKQTGLSPDTPITSQLLSSPQGMQLAKSMAEFEAGKPYPLDDQAWGRAQTRGLRGVSAPAGGTPLSSAVMPQGRHHYVLPLVALCPMPLSNGLMAARYFRIWPA